MKSDAVKIRPLADGRVFAGFAGSAADAFALLERFEAKLRIIRRTCRERPPNWPKSGEPIALYVGWKL